MYCSEQFKQRLKVKERAGLSIRSFIIKIVCTIQKISNIMDIGNKLKVKDWINGSIIR